MLHRGRSLTVATGVAGALLVTSLPSLAAATTATVTGRQLVNRFLTDTKKHNVTDLRKFLSPAFQIQRADGSRLAKTQYLAKLPTVRSFRLRNLLATSSGQAIVVTYQLAANEVINGKP